MTGWRSVVLRGSRCYPRQAPRNGCLSSISSNNQHKSAVERGVAPFKEVPDETFPAKVGLHLAGTFNGGLHHLRSPRGPMDWPVVSSISWGFHGGGGRTEVLEPLRIQCTPRGTPRATIRRRIESRSRPVAAPSLQKRPSNATIFALIRRGVDDEKNPSNVRQENPW